MAENFFDYFIVSADQAINIFQDICDLNPLFFEGLSATQYDLKENWNCDVKLNQRFMIPFDNFNNIQYLIRDSMTITEVHDGMAHQYLAISKNFANYPQIQEYLRIKTETLGYNRELFLLDLYRTSNPFDPQDIRNFQLEEDAKSLYHQLADLDYEPELFKK